MAALGRISGIVLNKDEVVNAKEAKKPEPVDEDEEESSRTEEEEHDEEESSSEEQDLELGDAPPKSSAMPKSQAAVAKKEDEDMKARIRVTRPEDLKE